MNKTKCTAIVLAAGRGKRMGTAVHKQYLLLNEKPVLYYSLNTFQCSEIIDEIILVVGKGEEDYCREEIVERYHFTKVTKITEGGAERYDSVWSGLQQIEDSEYVFIHDGARPFVDQAILQRVYDQVIIHKACVVGMPVKDTIKIVNENHVVDSTPDRSRVWIVQTPQVFALELVRAAYAQLIESKKSATDDAMVVEMMTGHPVKLVEGSYENIKITTPEDLQVGEVFVRKGSL